MTIQSPLLTLLLLAALALCGVATFRWKVFVEPDADTRLMFLLGGLVVQRCFTISERFSASISCCLIADAISWLALTSLGVGG